MTLDRGDAAHCATDIAEVLMAEFEPALPLSVITSVVLRAGSDLDGQVIEAAFPEMLHRLARQRLTQRQLGRIA